MNTRPGRPPTIGVHDIAVAACTLADAEGIEAVSMRAVGRCLGVTPMSLYRHIPDKQRLLQAMVELVAQDYDYDALPRSDWRAGLLALAGQQRRLIAAHPWLPGLASRSHPLGAATLTYVEHCLDLFTQAGVTQESLLETVGLFNGLVSTLAVASLGAAPVADAHDQQQLATLLESGQYPRFAHLARTAAPPLDLEEHFERLVGRLIDGLA